MTQFTKKTSIVAEKRHVCRYDIHRFKLPGSITHKWNTVKTQTTTRSYRSNVDNELQPNFHQNERLDINTGLYGQSSVRWWCRDRLQSATPKRDTTKQYSITSLLFSAVSPKSLHTSMVSCWLFYTCLFWKNVLCHNFGEFLLGEIFTNTNIQCSVT